MRSLLPLLLIFASSISVCNAQTMQGRITDAKTSLPIPFVSIGIIGTNTATVTNENGEFVIQTAKFPAKFRFSHVSYQQFETTIHNEKVIHIKLVPAAISLREIVIKPNEGKNLLKSALLYAREYIDSSFYAKAFYRQLTATNNKATEIHELFYDIAWNIKHIQGWAATQSRFAELNDPFKFSLSNQSFLTFSYAGYLFPDKRRRYVSVKYLDDYDIEIDRYIEQKDQNIAVISCKLKKTRKNLFYANSTYYVGVKDLKIYRLENKIYNLPLSLSPNLSFKFPPIASTIATFNGNNSPIPMLESISTKVYVSLYANDRELNSSISSLLTVFAIDPQLKEQRFQNVNSSIKDKKIIESLKYDDDFWRNNPIVKQTALEDNFIKLMESKNAFGTMTNP
ncbi:carboxypeptidase-like regulatory domain-containing protein [Pedobacter insulae]|uniref:CarboxypepD_reg-like domain-containing protein n=1 Tax=Pedobacter insulae TaxID=414048 RepID=A0A1I2US18_9SPHI|nr:carboxypeptidase-like regulatory domain-containing protein [Pedobacter insulae]SFG79019.1 CarboxypepD_reg-like domain-containing protein [Pedobacter insulae]